MFNCITISYSNITTENFRIYTIYGRVAIMYLNYFFCFLVVAAAVAVVVVVVVVVFNFNRFHCITLGQKCTRRIRDAFWLSHNRTFPLVSWVMCGTWLYRFLIFAPLLTFIVCMQQWSNRNWFMHVCVWLTWYSIRQHSCNTSMTITKRDLEEGYLYFAKKQ